ncbi:MAG TPA: DegT/DnrJ/EryC1/StrS family aminotransferase [Puia sp.]|jgi:dTDP-4-amino-4,6-dideoxygalactose transaminase
MINVNKPFLPPIEEYQELIKGIWSRNWLTNNGPLVNSLELKLKEYLDLPHLLFVTNGTIALQLAIKSLHLKGDIITTPFSYVATTSSIVWEGCNPVFCDIDPHTLNIDPAKIAEAITKNTTAILATHVYGNPCDVIAIEAIAKENNLRVIYDAAHAFGTKYKGQSLFGYGDISTTSFHATKLFHSTEGGAVMTNDPAILKQMAYMRNFGHETPEEFACVGINGKNSEFHAAMGLANLPYIDRILAARRTNYLYYDHKLANLKVQRIRIQPGTEYNYSYYPIIFESEAELQKAMEALNKNAIFPRRYFKPSLNELNYVSRRPTPISESIAGRVLCLPLFYGITDAEIDFCCRVLLRAQNN